MAYATLSSSRTKAPSLFFEKLFLAAALFLSAAALPWWLTTLLAVIYLAEEGSVIVVIFAGAFMDALFGVPVLSLHGFSFVYTLLFALLGGVTLFLRDRLYE